MTIRSANLGKGMSDEDVEDLLEIIEEKGVGSAFEDQRKLWSVRKRLNMREKDNKPAYLPVRIDAARSANVGRSNDNVGDEEDNGQEHGEDEDSESRARSDELDETKLVLPLDDVDEIDGRKDPPRVPLRVTMH